MVDPNDLILYFESKIEPCLSNMMYRAVSAKSQKRKSGYWATTARTDHLKWYQNEMAQELPKIIDQEKLEKFKYYYNTGQFDIEVESIHYMYYKRYYNFDASNLIKAHEDCVASYIGIDDSRTKRYEVEKVPVEIDNGWLVKTTMKLVKRHPLVEGMK